MLRATLAVLTVCLALLPAGCGIGSSGPVPQDYEKVTGIALTPAQPAAGELVEVRVQWASTHAYPQVVGYDRPSFEYAVNCGELIASPRTGAAELHGREITVRNETVQWQLPDEHGIARLKVALPDGSQSVEFEF